MYCQVVWKLYTNLNILHQHTELNKSFISKSYRGGYIFSSTGRVQRNNPFFVCGQFVKVFVSLSMNLPCNFHLPLSVSICLPVGGLKMDGLSGFPLDSRKLWDQSLTSFVHTAHEEKLQSLGEANRMIPVSVVLVPRDPEVEAT